MSTTDLLLRRRMMMGGGGSEPTPPSPDYRTVPLTFDILSDGSITLVNYNDGGDPYVFEYSKNGGEWTEASSGPNEEDWAAIPVIAGDELRFRGTAWPGPTYCQFASTCLFSTKGNPSSLKYGDTLTGNEELEEECLVGLFDGCEGLTSAADLALPATTLAGYCYGGMFSGCSSLTAAPELPATTLADRCYDSMFRECTSLTSAPALSATTLADRCYSSMFASCSSLTAAPELPATTLAESCYGYMFNGCSSLTAAPELPATTLAGYCYDGMFVDCSSLIYIKALFLTAPSNSYTYEWVKNVSPSGTFVKSSSASWDVTGDSGIPSNWTVVEE